MDASRYGRKVFEGLPDEDRRRLQRQLEHELDARLQPYTDWESYWPQVLVLVDQLKAIGHDLWSHDYDGDSRQLWGWDYMRLETAGFLQIQFRFQGRVTTYWRTENGRLGVESDEG